MNLGVGHACWFARQGGFQKGGFGGCSLEPPKPERGYQRRNDGTKDRKTREQKTERRTPKNRPLPRVDMPQNWVQQNGAQHTHTDGRVLYGAGAETLILVRGTSGKNQKLFVSRQKNQSQLWIPRKPRKIGAWASGAEIQTSAVDTRTAVWLSTPEKFSKIALGETRNFSRKFREVSAPAPYKNPTINSPNHP